MSTAVHPRREGLVRRTLRSVASIVLMLIAAGCAYLSLAVPEAPRESWWIFWAVYAVVGLPCLLGAGWLLRMR
jgi:hypothetical protein